MTQAYVENQGDAWSWLLRRLGEPDGLAAALAATAAIGRLTADLHAALASRPDDPRFPARPATAAERAAWRSDAEGLLARAVAVLEGGDRSRLAAIAPAISRRLAALDDPAVGPVRASRIHGDYHLGQLLVTNAGFTVIDFEGEPARPLAARCLPASPLRDVAGMLRSLDYAVRTAARDGRLEASVAGSWLERARAAFLNAYGRRTAGELALLAALEAEKACYEVVYEATSRPAWTWLPLEALERMAS
jgi:maltose alpha-D-glucosyltransferase/alpha-amylase